MIKYASITKQISPTNMEKMEVKQKTKQLSTNIANKKKSNIIVANQAI